MNPRIAREADLVGFLSFCGAGFQYCADMLNICLENLISIFSPQ